MLTSLHMPEVHECIKPKTSEIHSIHLLVTWYKKRDKLLFLNVVLYLHKIILIYSTSKQFTAGKPNIEVPLLPYTSKGSSNTLRTSLCNSKLSINEIMYRILMLPCIRQWKGHLFYGKKEKFKKPESLKAICF